MTTTHPTQGEHAQTEALRPIQRFNNIAGLMNPESRGLYVRYEDHAAQVAALTAQPAAPQGVAYAELPKDVIRAVFIENGFTVKEGQTDLKPYVYAAAEALLALAAPTPAAQADSQPAPVLVAALIAAKQAINSMKVEAETAAQGDEQMMLEACETISNEGLQADIAIRTALESAQSPAPSVAAVDYPHARRFGGCPSCGRSDCVAMSCTRADQADLLQIAARKEGGA